MKTIYALAVGAFLLMGMIISYGTSVSAKETPVETGNEQVAGLDLGTCCYTAAITPEAANAMLTKGDPLGQNTPATLPDAVPSQQDGGCSGGGCCASN